jgi:hypothetical protein
MPSLLRKVPASNPASCHEMSSCRDGCLERNAHEASKMPSLLRKVPVLVPVKKGNEHENCFN